MNQPSLFDASAYGTLRPRPSQSEVKPPIVGRVPHNGTETSREAAEQLERFGAETACGRVLAAIAAAGERGLTNQEIAERLDMREGAVCGRTNQLAEARRIEIRRPKRCSVFADGSVSRHPHQVWVIKTRKGETRDGK
ncbi:MAG: hypothetical protein ACLFV3_12165 [Phycisphaeraceae bacterium]